MSDAVNPREQIDSICNEFERGWSSDRVPDFESWLTRMPECSREQLAKELLAVHFELLLESGIVPDPSDFEHLGPDVNEFAANVVTRLRNAAQNYTVTFEKVQSLQGTDSFEVHFETRTHQSKPKEAESEIPQRLGDFRIIRKIGQGGMGSVFEAEHVTRGTRVALKTLPEVSAEALYLFKREFRSLARISHPNLVGLHRLESEGESWFFTMDLIRGTDFRSYVRPDGILDSDRLESAYRQLVDAVSELHSRHILHRDLKPSNVMIDESGTLKVLDFGLVFDMETEQELKANYICGTPAYMSPEQISGDELTPKSDWFAVGIMLFEAITGKLPWSGRTVTEVMDAKLEKDAPQLDTDAECSLHSITNQLLCRDPDQRLDPSKVSDSISTEDPEESRQTVSNKALLLGRETQLGLLRDVHDRFRSSGEPTAVFVSGRSGEGKTHLAEQFVDSIRDESITILSGRCYDRESVPFKAVDQLIESLTAYLAQRSGRELREILPKDTGLLAQVFPAFMRLREVEALTRNTTIPQDGREVRKRAFLALRELFQAISEEKPILLFLDDMQWGDAESAELIREIVRAPDPPRVMLLMTYRRDEAATSAFLKYWKNSSGDELAEHEVEIGPLSSSEIERLIESYVTRDDTDRFERVMSIANETGGNPFLLVEFLESLEGSGDEVRVRPLAEVIDRKLEQLPEEAIAILEYLAISGQAIELEDITDAYGAENLPMATIYRMQNENLLRHVGQDDSLTFDTYHDKIRETVLSGFDTVYKAKLHLQMARVIEEKVGGFPEKNFDQRIGQKNKIFDEEIQLEAVPRVYDLSYHYEEAGETDLAARYAFIAAFQAKSQFSLEVAVEQFGVFRRNSINQPQSVKYQAGEALGFCLLRLGEFEQSDQILRKTWEHANDEIERGRLASLRAEVCFESAQFERGREIAEEQLRELNVFLPRNRLVRITYGIWTVLWHCFYVRFLEDRVRRNRDWTRLDYVKYELLRKMIYLSFYINTPTHVMYFCRAAQRLARWKYNWCVADFEGIGAVTYAGMGLRAVAESKNRRALEFSKDGNDSRLLGNIKFGHSVICFINGQFDALEVSSRESTKLVEQTGDLWKMHGNQCITILSTGKRAEFDIVTRSAMRAIRAQLHVGAKAYALDAASFWTVVSLGNTPFEDLRELCHAYVDNAFQRGIYANAEIQWLLFHRRYRDALNVANDSISLAAASTCLSLFSVSLYPSYVKASCELVKHESDMESVERKRILKAAMKVSKWGLFHTRKFRLDRAWMLREHAELLRLLGRTRKAERFAVQSCQLAEEQGAKVDLIYSLRTLDQIHQELGHLDADDRLRQAESDIEAVEQSIRDANAGAAEFVQSLREQFG